MRKYLLLLYYVLALSDSTSAQDYRTKLETANSSEILHIIKELPSTTQTIYDIPCISPVQAQIFDKIHISSQYGLRIHPITQRVHRHSGIDIPPTGNDTIYAVANGIIDTVAYNNKLGLYIRIKHRFGYQTVYGHLSRLLIVNPYQAVRIGQPIAIMGTTGCSTGKHLHFSIFHYGKNIPPLPFCYLFIEIQSKN